MDIKFVSTSFDDYIVNKYFQGQLTSYWPGSFIEKSLLAKVKRRLQHKYLSMSAIKRIRKINYLCAIIRILLLICTSFYFIVGIVKLSRFMVLVCIDLGRPLNIVQYDSSNPKPLILSLSTNIVNASWNVLTISLTFIHDWFFVYFQFLL